MEPPGPISLDEAVAGLTFLPDRSPRSAETGWSASLAPYRDGAVFVAHYAGTSEWERHPVADEVVVVLDGATTAFLLLDGEEVAHRMGPHDLLVVPRGTWHRFETPEAVAALFVTPQPTDHQVERPG